MFSKLCRQVVLQATKTATTSVGNSLPKPAAKPSAKPAAKGFVKKATLAIGAFLTLGLTVGAVNALPPGTEDEIRGRLVPAGKLCRAGDDCGVVVAAGPATPRSGEEVYNQFCVACHSTGVGGAPITADVAAWEPRIAKGLDALWGTMQNGLNAMPPKGTCVNCSEEELRASMNFLVDSAR